jgi:hypothetical protein
LPGCQEVPARTVPTENDYVGNFKAYPLNTSVYEGTTFEAKAWKGSPVAMIIKSSLGRFQPVINPGIWTEERYPLQGQRTLVAVLMDLYSRPDPKAAKGAGKGPGQEEESDDKGPGKREQDEDEEEEEEEEEEEGVRRSKRRRSGTSKSTKGGDRRSNPPRKAHPSGPYHITSKLMLMHPGRSGPGRPQTILSPPWGFRPDSMSPFTLSGFCLKHSHSRHLPSHVNPTKPP